MNEVTELSPQEQMVRQQIVDKGIRNERVLAAMRSISRELFFPGSDRQNAYADRAAPIGHGQTISQPYMVALMTERLDVQPNHRVMEIGTGSGYQTAILARLAGGGVYTVERVKPLLDAAFERLLGMGIRNVHFRFGDGTVGWPEVAPFDRIIITAGAPQLPRKLLLSQLGEGGIAVLPVGPHEEQTLIEVRRRGDQLISANVCSCVFVKLIGQEGWEG